ncbi:hypothetical protein DPM19_13235 [Actinomadura craniellae]|uniref:DUF6458 domain-containing protein n=1 Tax=Actinomadura craniellae TaxID=2231787 RepID=A0A365H6U8_9ACTN|nr:DUF6458 family protein [Actinomadura craniellae]RAY14706.1 hypothetical protein DPM19_13235 [Actinomadura craniellae]
MGIGVSLAFIAIGAILTFALNVDLSGVNIQMVGLILMLVGLTSLAFTMMYTRPRRRGQVAEVVEEDPVYVVENDEPVPPHVHTEPAAAPQQPTSTPQQTQQPVVSTEDPPQPVDANGNPQPGRHLREAAVRRDPEA